jgi:hypothetical protein
MRLTNACFGDTTMRGTVENTKRAQDLPKGLHMANRGLARHFLPSILY